LKREGWRVNAKRIYRLYDLEGLAVRTKPRKKLTSRARVPVRTASGTTVTWAPKAEIVLPWGKTKTRRDRRIPISSRLQTVLDMRRIDPAGQPHAIDKFVFGTEVGTRVLSFGRAWHAAVLKSHGQPPAYTETANLTPASREALKAIDLHFHDLRREAASRWLDGGATLHTIRDWVGHANISQTSTYLAGTTTTQHDAMSQFEAHQTALQQMATKVGTGGLKSPRSAAGLKEKPSRTAVGRGSAIM
jgi:integrase